MSYLPSTYAFIDESGDLGFKKYSSKYFICAVGLTSDHRTLEHIIKKARLHLPKHKRQTSEFHASSATNAIRNYIFKNLARLNNLNIKILVVNKSQINKSMQNQANSLYVYYMHYLLDKLLDPIEVIIDQRDTNKYLQQALLNYPRHHIKLTPSHSNKSIQVVDFIAWAIFRKYELGDYRFYDLIKNHIVGEYLL